MKIFISGGCKNGKSLYAQELAFKQRPSGKPLYYLATMKPADAEDERRIARHIRERDGLGFETVEIANNIDDILKKCIPEGSFLLDSLTALLANEMFCGGGVRHDAAEKIRDDLTLVLQNLKNIVIVSDYIYSDAALYDSMTEGYRRGLALLDRVCAESCDIVLEICFGSALAHKGKEIYEKIR